MDPVFIESRFFGRQMDRTVLIVDSDPQTVAQVTNALATEGVGVAHAEDGTRALESAKGQRPDLVALELDLPDMSGFGLIRLFHEEPVLAEIPIVVVTRYGKEIDRIVAFELGVDDFVTKPFFGRELAGRIRAVLRRAVVADHDPGESRVRRQGDVTLDPDARTVTVGDDPVSLTPREFDLLSVLMDEAGRVLTRGRLVELVWGGDAAAGRRSVDTHVKTIRRKLGRGRRYLETVRGVGYRFSDH